MTKREVIKLVEAYQARLMLTHWKVEVEFDVELESKTADAMVVWDWSYDNAVVQLKEGWRDWSDDEAAKVIAHELLHLVLRDLEVSVADSCDYLPDDEKRHVRDRFQHEIEGVVDRLAVIVTGGL